MFGLYDILNEEFLTFDGYPVWGKDKLETDHLYFVLLHYQKGIIIKQFGEEDFNNYCAKFGGFANSETLLSVLLKKYIE